MMQRRRRWGGAAAWGWMSCANPRLREVRETTSSMKALQQPLLLPSSPLPRLLTAPSRSTT
jgi:hypothetical protein